MVGNAIAGLILIGIPLILILLRTNSALVLLSLLSGTVISSAVYADLLSVIKGALAPSITTGFIVYIVIALLPSLILGVWYRKSASKDLPFQILPAFLTGLNVFFVLYDAAPSKIQNVLSNSVFYGYISTYKQLVLAVGVATSMLALMVNYKPPKKDKE